ncbi:hypothetical protein B0I24_10975 [Aliidiomarina maris]|uniref:Uncharacterized protein n=1 Tax=Aliidiomarina maris TaxID=531312 RepID=A0A327WUR6_9GAMM|nr:hypothetical protein B0I24_10975 [Aliidiomarina maris]
MEQWVEATDGIHRLRPALAHGLTDGPLTIRDVSGFIGRYEAPHDDEFKARVVIATRLLAQYGPAWTGLYYDQSADYWAITYQRPVDIDGYHRRRRAIPRWQRGATD